MGFWINQGGGSPRKTVTPFGERCQRHDRVARQLKYIRHWRVIEGCYTSSPNVEATWFIDPPYEIAGKWQYRYGPKTIDYVSLGSWCKTRLGQTIVCENDGASWLPFEYLTRHGGMTDKGVMHQSTEVVYLNDSEALPLAA